MFILKIQFTVIDNSDTTGADTLKVEACLTHLT